MATLEQKITTAVAEVINALSCELVGVECHRSGHVLTVRIYIDKKGGVSIDDCADVSRQVNAIMDVEDFIHDKYNLEVSSPGLDRPLFTLAHYERFVGEKIVIHLRVPVQERRKWTGNLSQVNGDMITLMVDGVEHVFAFGNIQKGNIVYQFNS